MHGNDACALVTRIVLKPSFLGSCRWLRRLQLAFLIHNVESKLLEKRGRDDTKFVPSLGSENFKLIFDLDFPIAP